MGQPAMTDVPEPQETPAEAQERDLPHEEGQGASDAQQQAGGLQDGEVLPVESLCMRCGENGTTKILLTKVPHFRELVLMAFECPHCGEANNEVQFAGSLQRQGCTITLSVPRGSPADLDRQVVKSDSATIRIPELDFEIPPEAQRGTLSTVEGVLKRAATELQALQEERRKTDAVVAAKIDDFLARLGECSEGKVPFTLELDDPAGNSFIQSPEGSGTDPKLHVSHYDRTAEQNEKLGFAAQPVGSSNGDADTEWGTETAAAPAAQRYVPAGTSRLPLPQPHGAVGAPGMRQSIAAECSPEQAQALLGYSAPEEVMVFPAHCGACGAPSETRMYVTRIPYFKEVIVMSTTCDACGYRSSELKPGGSISPKGKRICLLVRSPRDLTRDVIKSDTASVAIPEVDLELAPGTLGGRVTTVEGLVTDIEENLGRIFPFQVGDSAPGWERAKWDEFRGKLRRLAELESEWHLILDDSVANSFIAPAGESLEDDAHLVVEEYERSWEQDEELGLHDMSTGEQGGEEDEGEGVEEGVAVNSMELPD